MPLPFLNIGYMRMGRYYRELDLSDEEEQQNDLQGVIDKEVESFAQACSGVYAKEVIDRPICKLLYHFLRL